MKKIYIDKNNILRVQKTDNSKLIRSFSSLKLKLLSFQIGLKNLKKIINKIIYLRLYLLMLRIYILIKNVTIRNKHKNNILDNWKRMLLLLNFELLGIFK